MPRLSKEDRERAIGMLQVGKPKPQVAQRFGSTVRTISRLWHCFNQTVSDLVDHVSTSPGMTVIHGYVIYGTGLFAPRSPQ